MHQNAFSKFCILAIFRQKDEVTLHITGLMMNIQISVQNKCTFMVTHW
jgi:hypothetical protein